MLTPCVYLHHVIAIPHPSVILNKDIQVGWRSEVKYNKKLCVGDRITVRSLKNPVTSNLPKASSEALRSSVTSLCHDYRSR